MSKGRPDRMEPEALKKERCLLAACPLATCDDERCVRCSGPVVWTDEDGRLRGVGTSERFHRACTSCPMNGLGLPVCWAGCMGPREDFSLDGQKMVTLGALEDPEKLIGAEMAYDALLDRLPAEDAGGFAPMLVLLAGRLLLLAGERWEAFRAACRKEDAGEAAKVAGAPLGAFRGPLGGWDGSAAAAIMERIGGLDADNWEAVRRLALGDMQKRVADLTLVRKQAMNQRIRRLEKGCGWVRKLLEKK